MDIFPGVNFQNSPNACFDSRVKHVFVGGSCFLGCCIATNLEIALLPVFYWVNWDCETICKVMASHPDGNVDKALYNNPSNTCYNLPV